MSTNRKPHKDFLRKLFIPVAERERRSSIEVFLLLFTNGRPSQACQISPTPSVSVKYPVFFREFREMVGGLARGRSRPGFQLANGSLESD